MFARHKASQLTNEIIQRLKPSAKRDYSEAFPEFDLPEAATETLKDVASSQSEDIRIENVADNGTKDQNADSPSIIQITASTGGTGIFIRLGPTRGTSKLLLSESLFLIALDGDIGIEIGSLLNVVNSNGPPELHLHDIPGFEFRFQYPATLHRSSNRRSVPSNQPWYILPAYAQMLAREYGIEEHMASLRTYSKQHRAISHPEPAEDYRGCLYESPRNRDNFTLKLSTTNLYAVFSNNNSTNFHYIHIRDRREINLWLFMRYIINFASTLKCVPTSMHFSKTDSEEEHMLKAALEHTINKWVSFDKAKSIAQASGRWEALQPLWDLEEGCVEVVPHRAHMQISCGHCLAVLTRNAYGYWFHISPGQGCPVAVLPANGISTLLPIIHECSQCRLVFFYKEALEQHVTEWH
jgi:hypothetical protein